jgi:hypothetical protein
MQNDGLIVVGQGKSDEIPSLILQVVLPLRFIKNDATHNEIFKAINNYGCFKLRVLNSKEKKNLTYLWVLQRSPQFIRYEKLKTKNKI